MQRATTWFPLREHARTFAAQSMAAHVALHGIRNRWRGRRKKMPTCNCWCCSPSAACEADPSETSRPAIRGDRSVLPSQLNFSIGILAAHKSSMGTFAHSEELTRRRTDSRSCVISQPSTLSQRYLRFERLNPPHTPGLLSINARTESPTSCCPCRSLCADTLTSPPWT